MKIKDLLKEVRKLKASLGDFPGTEKDKVDAEVYSNSGRKTLKKLKNTSIKELKKIDAILDEAYDAEYKGAFRDLKEIDLRVKELQEKKEYIIKFVKP